MNAIHVELKKFCEVIKIKIANQNFNKREIISQFFLQSMLIAMQTYIKTCNKLAIN